MTEKLITKYGHLSMMEEDIVLLVKKKVMKVKGCID